jgi:hypothetical protein
MKMEKRGAERVIGGPGADVGQTRRCSACVVCVQDDPIKYGGQIGESCRRIGERDWRNIVDVLLSLSGEYI